MTILRAPKEKKGAAKPISITWYTGGLPQLLEAHVSWDVWLSYLYQQGIVLFEHCLDKLKGYKL